jgi:hypothetical protein
LVASLPKYPNFVAITTLFLLPATNDSEAIRFIQHHVKPAGIVSTKGLAIRSAKKEGLQTIQRVFLIDTRSFAQSVESIRENNPERWDWGCLSNRRPAPTGLRAPLALTGRGGCQGNLT